MSNYPQAGSDAGGLFFMAGWNSCFTTCRVPSVWAGPVSSDPMARVKQLCCALHRRPPTSGSVTTPRGEWDIFQHVTLRVDASVVDLLGIKKRSDALRAIDPGDVDPAHFDTLDDDWDVETRSLATLDQLGLPTINVDRPVRSGGEAVLDSPRRTPARRRRRRPA